MKGEKKMGPERKMEKRREYSGERGAEIKGTRDYVGVTYIIESGPEEVRSEGEHPLVDVAVIPCHKDE